MTERKLTKKYKKRVQKLLKNDSDARKRYAEGVTKTTEQVLRYVRQEAGNGNLERIQKLEKYIKDFSEDLGEEILFLLELIAGDDIEVNYKKRPERWEILDFGKKTETK